VNPLSLFLRAERVDLRPADLSDVGAIEAYHRDNRTHLALWEPERHPDYYSPPMIAERIELRQKLMELDRQLNLLVVERSSSRIIGECNLTDMVWGPFMCCQLGYSIAADHQGQGYMSEALTEVIRFVFDTLGLHRIQACHMPANLRSAALLERLGFRREGLARAYLRINGRWEDHVLSALINDS